MSALIPLPPAPAAHGDLRLRLREGRGRAHLDGGWWPYSRDLAVEIRHLVEHFPADHGRVTRVLFSRPDWDSAPRRVDLGNRVLKVGSFPDDDTHLLVVTTSNNERLTLLVVPPGFSQGQGDEALLAAATPGNAHPAGELLVEVTDSHDADPAQEWTRGEDGAPYQQAPRG